MQVTVTIRVTTDSLFQLDESRESPATGALWFYDFMSRFTLLTHAAFPFIRKAMFQQDLAMSNFTATSWIRAEADASFPFCDTGWKPLSLCSLCRNSYVMYTAA